MADKKKPTKKTAAPVETEVVALAPIDAVSPHADGFKEKVTPKKPDEKLFLNKCSGCQGIHFRHAGYVQNMLPFLMPGGDKKVSVENLNVMVCVKCRRSYVWVFNQMYEVTENIDLGAWEKFEVEAHNAIGPGGNNC